MVLWARALDAETEPARAYARRFLPTETYDPAVALLATRVLILGRRGSFEGLKERLRRLGCVVERFDAEHDYSVARRLSDLVAHEVRYPSELPEAVREQPRRANGRPHPEES